MRIALVSQEYPPETAKGGIGSQTYQKAHGLSALGHQVFVVSRAIGERLVESKDGAIAITRVPGFSAAIPPHTAEADWITYSAQVAAALWQMHSQVRFDIVDFPEWGAEGFVHLINRTPWNRIPSVVHIHGPLVMLAHTLGWPEPDSEFYRVGTFMEGSCLRLADAVYSSSSCSAEWCARQYSLDRQSIPILHSGIDTRLFRPMAVPKDEHPTIVFAGKLARNKGVEMLLEASLRLAGEIPGLKLRLLGRGEAHVVERLEKRALAAGNPDLLQMTGFIPQQDLPLEFSRAHVFAAPSEYEGGPGFSYLEAMACGLPVVACDGSGAAESVDRHSGGFLVNPGDLDGLCAALQFILQDEERRETLGKKARAHVTATADGRDCIRRIEAFYLQVLEKAGGGGMTS